MRFKKTVVSTELVTWKALITKRVTHTQVSICKSPINSFKGVNSKARKEIQSDITDLEQLLSDLVDLLRNNIKNLTAGLEKTKQMVENVV